MQNTAPALTHADTAADPLPGTQDPADPVKQWRAQLQMGFISTPARTVLGRLSHEGPLRVQRPFYPEGDCCHVYILHPPGGMVPGDSLAIAADIGVSASVLLTTPAAGKIYRSDHARTAQHQGIVASLKAGSRLDWLPQETIVFNGAEVTLRNRFELQGDASLIAWDIVCLGRRSSGERFAAGNCRQQIEVLRDGRPLLVERTHFAGGSDMLAAQWGMQGCSVSGSMVATLTPPAGLLDSLREQLAALQLPGEWALTARRGVLIARHLGDSPQRCRQGFEWLWQQLRPLVNGRDACRPRIWNT